MKTQVAIACVLFGALLGPSAAMADATMDNAAANSKEFVKDSAITAQIKTKLAAEHITSLGRISVDTDKNGVVWLSGTARTQEAIDKAISIARGTEHVTTVHSTLTIKQDD
jgi:hyperosmotically inducible protein